MLYSQICKTLSQIFSTYLALEHLELSRSSKEYNGVNRTERRKRLTSFSNVKTIRIDVVEELLHTIGPRRTPVAKAQTFRSRHSLLTLSRGERPRYLNPPLICEPASRSSTTHTLYPYQRSSLRQYLLRIYDSLDISFTRPYYPLCMSLFCLCPRHNNILLYVRLRGYGCG